MSDDISPIARYMTEMKMIGQDPLFHLRFRVVGPAAFAMDHAPSRLKVSYDERLKTSYRGRPSISALNGRWYSATLRLTAVTSVRGASQLSAREFVTVIDRDWDLQAAIEPVAMNHSPVGDVELHPDQFQLLSLRLVKETEEGPRRTQDYYLQHMGIISARTKLLITQNGYHYSVAVMKNEHDPGR